MTSITVLFCYLSIVFFMAGRDIYYQENNHTLARNIQVVGVFLGICAMLSTAFDILRSLQ